MAAYSHATKRILLPPVAYQSAVPPAASSDALSYENAQTNEITGTTSL